MSMHLHLSTVLFLREIYSLGISSGQVHLSATVVVVARALSMLFSFGIVVHVSIPINELNISFLRDDLEIS